MTDTAELLIRPKIVGDVSGEMRRIVGTADQAQTHQSRMLGRGVSDAERLRAAYSRVATAVGVVGREANLSIRNSIQNIFSLRTAVMGFIAGTAGRTILDATIGSADRIQRQRALMRSMLNDASLVAAAERRALELTQEISSLGREQAMQGLGSLMGLAGGDIDRAAELLRLAKALESTSPEQGFEGALFALREIESGDVMSLRERFRIRLPTREEAETAARRAQQTLQQYYFGELNRQLDQRYGGGRAGAGVASLLAIDMNSLSGQWANIRTIVSDALTSIGEAAQGTLTTELPRLAEELRAYVASPEFQEGARSLSDLLVRGARGAFDLARWLPGAVRSISDFFREHGTLIRTLAVGVGVNQLTGGLLTRAAGGLIGGGARLAAGGIGRLLFGARGGAVGSALGGAVGGAVPVYVVNMGMGMGGGGVADYLGRNALGGGGGGLGGLVGRLGLGGLGTTALVGGTIFGSLIAAGYTLYDSFSDINSTLRAVDERAARAAEEREQREEERERQQRGELSDSEQERQRQVLEETGGVETPEHMRRRIEQEALDSVGANLSRINAIANRTGTPAEMAAMAGMDPGDMALNARATILGMFGEGARWTGSEEQTGRLAAINEVLAQYGIRAVAPRNRRPVSEMQFAGGYTEFLPQDVQQQTQEWLEWQDRTFIDPATGQPGNPRRFDDAERARLNAERVVTGRRTTSYGIWDDVVEEGPTRYEQMRSEMEAFATQTNRVIDQSARIAGVMSNPIINTGRSRVSDSLMSVGNINIYTNTAEEGGREAAEQVQAGLEQGLSRGHAPVIETELRNAMLAGEF